MTKIPHKADTILLVDDEPMYLVWLEDFLLTQNLKVEFVENADEAIQRARINTYRAYMVDLNIPVSEKLKKSDKNRSSLDVQYPG